MAERIYIVHGPQGTRLVKASLRQQALSHVASQDDLVAQITAGTKIEQYRAPEQADLTIEG